jgi:hypothetical protein
MSLEALAAQPPRPTNTPKPTLAARVYDGTADNQLGVQASGYKNYGDAVGESVRIRLKLQEMGIDYEVIIAERMTPQGEGYAVTVTSPSMTPDSAATLAKLLDKSGVAPGAFRTELSRMEQNLSAVMRSYSTYSKHSTPHKGATKYQSFPDAVENLTKAEYIQVFTPMVQDVYGTKYRRRLTNSNVEQLLTSMYDSATRTHIPKILLPLIGGHESWFGNVEGDLNHQTKGQPNHAIGIYQILEGTVADAAEHLERLGIPPPEDLSFDGVFRDVGAQSLLAAGYLNWLVTRHMHKSFYYDSGTVNVQNLNYAMSKWNAGPHGLSPSYVKKVKGLAEKYVGPRIAQAGSLQASVER